jgi:serine/threonine protein phosphatase 1
MRQLFISDIHGYALTFRALLQALKLKREDQLYLLGDYIDRGPDSQGVIDHIMQLQASGFQVNCLRGNHEEMLLESLADKDEYLESWLYNGGHETLESFGVQEPAQIPRPYIEWIKALPYYIELPKAFLVHAGLEFTDGDPLADRDAMLWTRGWYDQLDRTWLGDRVLLHGHTPTRNPEREAERLRAKGLPIINLDGGCFAYNWLWAYELGAGQWTKMMNRD